MDKDAGSMYIKSGTVHWNSGSWCRETERWWETERQRQKDRDRQKARNFGTCTESDRFTVCRYRQGDVVISRHMWNICFLTKKIIEYIYLHTWFYKEWHSRTCILLNIHHQYSSFYACSAKTHNKWHSTIDRTLLFPLKTDCLQSHRWVFGTYDFGILNW